jgi:hypothetical protein
MRRRIGVRRAGPPKKVAERLPQPLTATAPKNRRHWFSGAGLCPHRKPTTNKKGTVMKLLTDEQREQMLANGRTNAGREETYDFKPVVKLFCPWGGATWLLTELDPDDSDIAFGLCDLGQGFPELGNVSLGEIDSVRGPGGLRIERDLYFKPEKTLTAYADEARLLRRIQS